MDKPKFHPVLEDVGVKAMRAITALAKDCKNDFEKDTLLRVLIYAAAAGVSKMHGNADVHEYLSEIAKHFPIDNKAS